MSDSFLPEDEEEEVWKPVHVAGEFEVSNLGRVRRAGTGKLKRLSQSRLGYRVVNLYAYGFTSTQNVHCLVAQAFLGPQPSGQIVVHIDGDKDNNRSSNLCYAPRAGRILPPREGTARGRADHPGARIGQKIGQEQVDELRERLAQGEVAAMVAQDYGLSEPHVSAIRHRRKWRGPGPGQ